MKLKTSDSGVKYFFYEEDRELDRIALKFLTYMVKHSGLGNLTLREKLWRCAMDYLESAPKSDLIFRRSLDITNTPDTERIHSLIDSIITTIVKSAGAEKERNITITWDENSTRTTQNAVVVRSFKKGKFIALKSNTEVLIGSVKDINGLLKTIDRDIDTITYPELAKITYRVIQDQSKMGEGFVKDLFKSVVVVYEDLPTELGMPIKDIESNREQMRKLFLQNLTEEFNGKSQPLGIKKLGLDIDVLNDVDF